MIKVNAEDLSRGKLFAPGKWYRVKVVSFSEEQSRGDNPSTNYIWKLVAIPTGDPETDAYAGSSPGVLFNERGIDFRFEEFMSACGITKDADGGYSVEGRALVGKELEVFVKHRADKNDKSRFYNDCSSFRKVGD